MGDLEYYAGQTYARFLHEDWLGSARFTSRPHRNLKVGTTAYGPFGENYVTSGVQTLEFTGQFQDSGMTDSYDFPARKYNTVQGRWISPDPAGIAAADPSNPQTWNRYAYVMNNPLSFVDSLGLKCDNPPCQRGEPGGPWQDVAGTGRRSILHPEYGWSSYLWYTDDGILVKDSEGNFPTGATVYAYYSSGETNYPSREIGTAANKTTNCSHGFGIGIQGGGTAAACLKSGGVVTGQAGGGLFVNSSGQPSVGGYVSGALAGRWGSSTGGYPAQSLQAPWVGGAYAGYGPGIFLTNAGSPSQLGGRFAVLNVDIGIGIGKASISLAADKSGTFILTINGGPAPYSDGLGFDVSGFTSNTKAGGTGCK